MILFVRIDCFDGAAELALRPLAHLRKRIPRGAVGRDGTGREPFAIGELPEVPARRSRPSRPTSILAACRPQNRQACAVFQSSPVQARLCAPTAALRMVAMHPTPLNRDRNPCL
jgi:hypothetical protein